MGFFKRLVPIKGMMSLGFTDIDLSQGRLKGQAHLECEEPVRVEEVRIEAKAYESYTDRRRDSKGHYEPVHRTDVYFEKTLPISQPFEAPAGHIGNYVFEIEVPFRQPRHGGNVSRMVKAVANVKGRPDMVSKEMFPFHEAREAQNRL